MKTRASFTTWQIDKIRDLLIRYRAKEARNGYRLPWKTVEIHVSRSPQVAQRYGRGKDALISQERMRRFAKREEIPSPDKLDQLALFLGDKGLLTDDSLEKPSPHFQEAVALHEYLAVQNSSVKVRLSELPGRYVAGRERRDGFVQVTLHIIRDCGDTMFAVEETSTTRIRPLPQSDPSRDRVDALFRKDDFCATKATRTGYGFFYTDLELLYMFVRGALRNPLLNYVESVPTIYHNPMGPIILARHGESGAHDPDEQDETRAVRYNVYRFEPQPDALSDGSDHADEES